MAKTKTKLAEEVGVTPSQEGTIEVADEMAPINKAIKAIESEGVKVRRPQPNSPAATQLFYFASQPKIRYRLARPAGEKAGAFTPVTVNDLMITVMHGFNVDLPQDIANILDESQQITDNAIHKNELKDLPAQLQD